MKRQRHAKLDRLSDLPDSILLHIMKFMNIKHAVQTCILSTRWKDLWKHLTDLTLFSMDFSTPGHFSKFVSRVLSRRHGTASLHKLAFSRFGTTKPKLLNRVMRYAVSHNVQQLTIYADLQFRHDFQFPPCIFSCKSLTFLKIAIRHDAEDIKLPKSLELPALRCLHLKYVSFTESDKHSVDPFSNCKMLNTLVINCCSFQNDAAVLRISNSKLSGLTVINNLEGAHKVVLSTPHLSSVTISDSGLTYQLSACDLPFLEEVNIDTYSYEDGPKKALDLISWLEVLANVKKMTLSLITLEILKDLSNPGSTQPPCFARLKSLKVTMRQFQREEQGEETASRIVNYLLQNSPPAKVDMITL